MEAFLNHLMQQVSMVTPRVGMGILVFIAFWVVSIVVQKVIRRIGRHSDLTKDVRDLLEGVSKAALLVFGGITALGTMGIDVSALVAGLGLTGFALGFAFRDILSNALAGTLILIYRPFQRNDRIVVTGFEGIVIEIGLRYTVLQTEDKRVLIPNSILFTNAVSVLTGKP